VYLLIPMISKKRELAPSSTVLADFFRQLPSRRLVLQAIYNAGSISRAEIARETGLTKVTVSDVVAQMLSFDLLSESAPPSSTGPGKPPVLLQLKRDHLRTIALDLSITDSVVIGSVDLYGQPFSRSQKRLDIQSPSELVESLRALIQEEIDSSPLMVLGIGVGVPGVVDDEGIVIDGAALNLHNFDLRTALSDHFGIEVHVANDANAAAQADSLFGGAEQSSMLIRIANGVGSGLMLDGKPFLGSSFASGELGHVVVVREGAKCACGKRGCLEAEIAALLGEESPNQERIGHLLGAVLAPIVSVLNLGEIVLSTPSGIGGQQLVSALLTEIRNSTLPETFEGLVVRETKLGGDVVLLGAAAMALSAVLGVA
jgi:predicted NBD/HSP70 family sugar kinase